MNNFLAAVTFLLSLAATTEIFATDFEQRENAELDFVFVRKNSDFSSYRAVTVSPISVWYPVDTAPPGDREEEARGNLEKAQTLFRKLLSEALDKDHELSETAGKKILKLHVEFIDLRSIEEYEQIPEYVASKKFRTKPGYITMVAELSDSASGVVLARVADLGKKKSSGTGTDVDWEAIEFDLRNWVSIFADWFNQIHPHDE